MMHSRKATTVSGTPSRFLINPSRTPMTRTFPQGLTHTRGLKRELLLRGRLLRRALDSFLFRVEIIISCVSYVVAVQKYSPIVLLFVWWWYAGMPQSVFLFVLDYSWNGCRICGFASEWGIIRFSVSTAGTVFISSSSLCTSVNESISVSSLSSSTELVEWIYGALFARPTLIAFSGASSILPPS